MNAAAVLGDMTSLAADWRKEATDRREIAKVDPVAEALEYCAGELEQRVAMVASADASETVTVDEYAALQEPPVTPQTVRAWIRNGELAARKTAHGYAIPRQAERIRRAS